MVQVTVSNNIRVRGLTNTKLKAEITAALTIPNPEYQKRRKLGKPIWGIDKNIQCYLYDQSDLVLPRGFQGQLFDILDQAIDYQITKDLSEGRDVDFGSWNSDLPLRDYQEEALQASLKNNGVLVAAAGAGKTNIGIKYIFEKKKAALWLTHSIDLINQTKERAEKLIPGIGKVGVIAEGKVNYGDGRLIVAMVQTLIERPQIIAALNDVIGTVVIDESHRTPCYTFMEIIAKLKAKNMLGITATPDRADSMEPLMYFGIGPLLYTVKRDELYENDNLIKPEIKFVYTDFDYDEASVLNANLKNVDAGGDEFKYHVLLQHLINDKERLELVTNTIANNAAGNYNLVVSENVRYCYMIRDLLRKKLKNLIVECIHGPLSMKTWKAVSGKFEAVNAVETGKASDWRLKGRTYQIYINQYTDNEFQEWQISKQQRKDILECAVNRKIDVLIVTQLAREGLDICCLNQGFLVTPKKGDTQGRTDGAGLEQFVGRIMRSDPLNKDKKAVWWDFCDRRNGMFYSQYLTRRKTYKRIGLVVPNAPKTKIQEIDAFLDIMSNL